MLNADSIATRSDHHYKAFGSSSRHKILSNPDGMTLRKRPGDDAGGKRLTRLRVTPNRLEKVNCPSRWADTVADRLGKDVQMLNVDGKGEVRAYVVLALRPGNDVTVMTSDDLKTTVQPLMREWASSHLPRAHEYSGFVENHDRAVAEGTSMRCGSDKRYLTATSYHTE